MRPEALAALAAPGARAGGPGRTVLWYVIGGFLLAVAIAGVSNMFKGEDIGASIGAIVFCLISAWASFRYARRLERRRQ